MKSNQYACFTIANNYVLSFFYNVSEMWWQSSSHTYDVRTHEWPCVLLKSIHFVPFFILAVPRINSFCTHLSEQMRSDESKKRGKKYKNKQNEAEKKWWKKNQPEIKWPVYKCVRLQKSDETKTHSTTITTCFKWNFVYLRTLASMRVRAHTTRPLLIW